jgi:hypothetical protein
MVFGEAAAAVNADLIAEETRRAVDAARAHGPAGDQQGNGFRYDRPSMSAATAPGRSNAEK